MGAWIETPEAKEAKESSPVAPLVGAWIETTIRSEIMRKYVVSHPSWVRGLKLAYDTRHAFEVCVAPLVGAWIETKSRQKHLRN